MSFDIREEIERVNRAMGYGEPLGDACTFCGAPLPPDTFYCGSCAKHEGREERASRFTNRGEQP